MYSCSDAHNNFDAISIRISFSPPGSAFKSVFAISTAVSYTHLDVYKRQLDFHAMLLKLESSQDIGFGYYTDSSDLQITVDWK